LYFSKPGFVKNKNVSERERWVILYCDYHTVTEINCRIPLGLRGQTLFQYGRVNDGFTISKE